MPFDILMPCTKNITMYRSTSFQHYFEVLLLTYFCFLLLLLADSKSWTFYPDELYKTEFLGTKWSLTSFHQHSCCNGKCSKHWIQYPCWVNNRQWAKLWAYIQRQCSQSIIHGTILALFSCFFPPCFLSDLRKLEVTLQPPVWSSCTYSQPGCYHYGSKLKVFVETCWWDLWIRAPPFSPGMNLCTSCFSPLL